MAGVNWSVEWSEASMAISLENRFEKLLCRLPVTVDGYSLSWPKQYLFWEN